MSGVIDLRNQGPDPLQLLLQQLMHEKQLKLEKERLGIDQKRLEMQQQAAQQKQQEDANQFHSAFQTLMSGQQDPNVMQSPVGGQIQQALSSLGNANVPNQQAQAQIMSLAQPQEMGQGNKAGPSAIAQQQQLAAQKALDAQLQKMLPAEEYGNQKLAEITFQHAKAVGLSDEMAAKEAEKYRPIGAKEATDIAEANLRIKAAKSLQESRQIAYQAAAAKGFNVTPEEAPQFMADLQKQKELFKQNLELEGVRQSGENNRAALARQAALQQDLRKSYEGNALVETSTDMAALVNTAQKVAKQGTGAGDLALADLAVRATVLGTGARGVPQAQFKVAVYKTMPLNEKAAVFLGPGHWTQGAMLTEQARARMLATIEQEAQARKDAYDKYTSDFSSQAWHAHIDPSQIVINPWKNVTFSPTAEERVKKATGQ